jgi:hypothetical protein
MVIGQEAYTTLGTYFQNGNLCIADPGSRAI